MSQSMSVRIGDSRWGAALVLCAAFGAPDLCVAAKLEAPQRCADLRALVVPGFDVSIEEATPIPEGPPAVLPPGEPADLRLPSHCRVDGVIDKRVGQNGRSYAIGFSIALPDQWNGRFLFQGGGGLNGTVTPPLGAQATGAIPALARGYAVISTDSGHKGAVFDATFMEDQQATLDFLYRAVGVVAQVGKAIVRSHYGRSADHAYFVGCSTGGREAMMMSQRYPDYFDGIVAGAPAMRTNYSNLADRWVAIALNQVAPRDDAGRPDPVRAFSDGDKRLVVEGVLKACDANDGLADGMIFAVGACRFDPGSLVCHAPKTEACITQTQAAALTKGFSGPRDSRGVQVYPGFWFDTGIAAPGPIAGLLSSRGGPVGPPITATEMDVDREEAAAANAVSAVGDTASWTQLSTFKSRGGKLLFYHGVSDPWFSAQDTVRYYEQLAVDNGGPSAVSQWSRLFLVPGMGHCRGGEASLDRFDMLEAVVAWVEKSLPPDSVVATGKSFPARSRPLCPYPLHTHYKGTGDPEKAANFECRS